MTALLARVVVVALAIGTGAVADSRTSAAPESEKIQALRWQTIGELAHPRVYASAVALSSGEILVVGGFDPDESEIMSRRSELVDVRNGTVSELPQQIDGRIHHSVTVTSDDRVVVAGGVVRRGTVWEPMARVEVYVATTHTWMRGQPLRQARSDHAATLLGDGRVLITGGNRDTLLLDTAELYDVKSDGWTDAAPMPHPRTQHSAHRLVDGRVLVAGGIDEKGKVTATTFLYDPRTDTWSDGPPLVLPRLQHVAAPLPSGDILFAGGDGAASGTSERYDTKLGRFVLSGTLTYPRLVAQGAALRDGRVVLVGGVPPRSMSKSSFAPLRSAEIWDPVTGRWSELPPGPTPRALATIVKVGGSLYQLSGSGDDESAYRTIERLALE